MRRAGLIVLTGLMMVLTIGAAGDGKRPSEAEVRKELVGLWKGFAVEGKGERPDRGPVKLELTITEKTIHGIEIKGEEKIDHGTGEYTLDQGAEITQLDGTQVMERGRKRAWVGIYALEGDTLKWCVGPRERPTTFETKKGQFLLVLKRQKEESK